MSDVVVGKVLDKLARDRKSKDFRELREEFLYRGMEWAVGDESWFKFIECAVLAGVVAGRKAEQEDSEQIIDELLFHYKSMRPPRKPLLGERDRFWVSEIIRDLEDLQKRLCVSKKVKKNECGFFV